MNPRAPAVPPPVRPIVAILWADRDALDAAKEVMVEAWGELDYEGADHVFDATDYYRSEMGEGLHRRLVSFRELMSPESLVERRLRSGSIEDSLRGPNGRRVNLDPGYLDLGKVVLASLKGLSQKIYLGRGVYADLLLRFHSGAYRPFDWTFPDFRDQRYERELLEMRARYRSALAGRGDE